MTYIIQFWGLWLIVLICLLEVIARLLDTPKITKNTFSYSTMPVMQPVRIPTAGTGIIKALWIWVTVTRKWRLVYDFYFVLNGKDYYIPAGFEFDGASIPKFLRTIVSPTGIMLAGALVHDYGYANGCLLESNGTMGPPLSQKRMDKIFRDINILDNGFTVINYIAYYALRMFGFFAWYTKRGRKLNESSQKDV